MKLPETGAIIFVQRFGSAINFNLHYHILLLDGAYSHTGKRFLPITDLSNADVERVITAITKRIIKLCQRQGLITDYPEIVERFQMDDLFEEHQALTDCLPASIKGKIAFGERAGQYVRYLGRAFGFEEEIPLAKGHLCFSQNGFSIQAATSVRAGQRKKLERLVKYVARPPIATHRLSKAGEGLLKYKLKTPFRDGKTHVLLSPGELLEKLAAIIPPPKAHIIKYAGVFAPAHRLRREIVLEPDAKKGFSRDDEEDSPPKRMSSWRALLARSFKIDLSICPECGGELEILSAVLSRQSIDRYLKHMGYGPDPPPLEGMFSGGGGMEYVAEVD